MSGLLQEGFRWYGPNDPVPLEFVRQTGASHVFTALHEIPYGEVGPIEEIRKRKELIESAGLKWTVVESVPVHEDIKTGRGDLARLFSNYADTIIHLAQEGICTVVYNFMPVLDWIRTDKRHKLPDGSECLLFNPVHFAAFEIHALQRPGAHEDYSGETIEACDIWWAELDHAARKRFIQSIIDVFPGLKLGLGLADIRAMLARYDGTTPDRLRENLVRFLEAVVPIAETHGTKLAIHPDDPPFPVLGLPRIVSTELQIAEILSAVESPANGLCFCTGSLSARPDNDLIEMVKRFAPRINAVHLRSTARLPDGSFYEADHLSGSVPMAAIVEQLLIEQDRRGEPICFRPDHGHVMLDDLAKTVSLTPGYSCIGRMRGLAELRGLMMGILHSP
jgi:mannonate dehydratase